MKKIVVLLLVVFASIFPMSVYADETEKDFSIKTMTGIIIEEPQTFKISVDCPNGCTMVRLYNGYNTEEIMFQGYYVYFLFEYGREIKLIYQYSERDGNKGFVILAVDYTE